MGRKTMRFWESRNKEEEKMGKKIAVLHAQVPFVHGGAEINIENLTNNLRRRGFQAEIVTIPFKWYPINSLLDSYFLWRTVDLTESNGEKIDMVIALKVPTYMLSHPNKVVWVMHQFRQAYDLRDNAEAGGLNYSENGSELIKKITEMDNLGIGEAKGVYTNSQNVAGRLMKYNNIQAKPLYHPPALAGQYKSGEFGNYILSVGRLDKNKRIGLLIRALKYCDKSIHVKIAGRGPEMEMLQALAHELHVEKRVDFLGFVADKDVIDLYSNALAVCYPPLDEDYGYVTLEAFLSQKPILTCKDSGGVLEFAQNGENGYIVDYDAQQMGKCFQKLYLNKKQAAEMGRAGYERVKDISWDHVIDELTKTIR